METELVKRRPSNDADWSSQSAGAVNLRGIAELLWRRKWLLLICLVVSVAGGWAYVSRAEPIFSVSARLLVQQQNLPMSGNALRRDAEFLATQAEIVGSPTVIERALSSLGWSSDAPSPLDQISRILESLQVEPVKGTNVLDITYRSHDAAAAVQLVDQVISAYRDYLREMERDSHVEILSFLTRTEKESREELLEQEQAYAKLRQESSSMGLGAEAARVQQQSVADLGERLNETRNKRIQLENQYQSLAQWRDAPAASRGALRSDPRLRDPANEGSGFSRNLASLPIASKSGLKDVVAIESIQLELLRAEVREKELRQKYGYRHPKIRGVQEEIASWELRLREILDTAPAVLERELEDVRQNEEKLAALYQAEVDKAKLLDISQLKEKQALDAIERTRLVHESMLTQLREWQLKDQVVADGRSEVSVTVLAAPTMPEGPIWPSPPLVLGICASLGLMGGCGLSLAWAHFDRTPSIPFSAELVERLDMPPILARIPSIQLPRGIAARPWHRGRIVHMNPDSPPADAFRSLCERLEATAEHQYGRIIQMVSPSGEEASSTVTSNVAFCLAQSGKKVLVVDADLRSGILHEVFKVSSSLGVSSMLREGTQLEDAIQRSPVADIDVLARGPDIIEDPVVLFAQPQLSRLLESVRHQYDVVLIDTPALLAFTETSVLASKTDGVVLNLCVARSSMPSAGRACELLAKLGANVLGIVVNRSADAFEDSMHTPETQPA